jgi:hypothetical protein
MLLEMDSQIKRYTYRILKGNRRLVAYKNKSGKFYCILRRNGNMMYWNRQNVFSLVATLSAVGFAWFTFLSPETVNAAVKSNYCLIAFFAALAGYFYSKGKENECDTRISDIYAQMDRNYDDVNRRLENEVDSLHTKVEHIRASCPTACDRKGR